jgi:tyrosine-specific transport protein
MENRGTTAGGALLVAGTSIGGGMLALPVWTSLTGFIPSMVVYSLCWLFMVCTGLLFVEITQWMKRGANIVSMAEFTMGRTGRLAAWGLYLFLFYSLSLAYIVGCGDLLVQFSYGYVPENMGPVIFVLLFAPIVFAGTVVVSRINSLLMVGLGASFLAFIVLGFQFVEVDKLLYRDWSYATTALPIAFTAFAYQGLVPTLVDYMNGDVRRTRMAIVIGSAVTLLTYLCWQWLIQGIVPTYGPGGLAEALAAGSNAVKPLKSFIDVPAVYYIGEVFAFCALVTSFFGVALGLLDFLADGLKVEKTAAGKLFLCALLFIPPLLVAYTHPHLFLVALDYAGGYGCALLLGLLPIMMVAIGRYKMRLVAPEVLPGGKWTLILLTLFVLFELSCQLRQG